MSDLSARVEEHHLVRIHINREPVESPTPTTGAALYALGKIGAHSELFSEATGDREDEVVSNDGARIELKNDQHFYSERDFKIVVNGQQKTVIKKIQSYADLVALAYPNPAVGPEHIYTITYRKGPKENPEGELAPGQSLVIKEGMVFNVTPTVKS